MVREASCPGPAEEGGDVLNADDEAGERGAVSQAEMDVGRENGERQTDGEIDDKREIDVSGDRLPAAAGCRGICGAQFRCCQSFHAVGGNLREKNLLPV